MELGNDSLNGYGLSGLKKKHNISRTFYDLGLQARHQAPLNIQSKFAKGSRFTARFPAGRVVPAAAQPASA